ncbi:hypothetical protein Fot_29065 [Forsythia ovata]|uniref:Uncharacterized protein n=1 Tax=Forsythia ovata TaxID=205694 RepID=A0ABD1TQV8_9LAMI
MHHRDQPLDLHHRHRRLFLPPLLSTLICTDPPPSQFVNHHRSTTAITTIDHLSLPPPLPSSAPNPTIVNILPQIFTLPMTLRKQVHTRMKNKTNSQTCAMSSMPTPLSLSLKTLPISLIYAFPRCWQAEMLNPSVEIRNVN